MFGCILALQLAVAAISIDLMSAVRAYATGESWYTKGQKEAHVHLLNYAQSASEEDYKRFLLALAIPRGDRIAREALQRSPPNPELAQRGLLQSGTHPDDIPGAIRLFLWFHHTRLMSDAIATWTEGDALIEQLALLAARAHEGVLAGNLSAPAIQNVREQAPRLNERLTDLEITFTRQLGEGARLGQQLLLATNVAFAIVLALMGSAFVLRSTRVQAAAEERSLRAQREHVEAMREANESRSMFLAKVSHELRSPLQGIVSALDVLELRQAHSTAEEGELIRRVRRSSLLLNTHLNDLVTLAKGQAGHLEVRPSPFDACALLESVAAAAHDLAAAKGLELRVDTPDEPIFATADSARIDQILTNLVVNSIRYTERGFVYVALSEFEHESQTLQFRVSDSGPGIDAEVLPTLFSPDSTPGPHSRRGEGSGIGLAIVRTLVRLLDGCIDVVSEPGNGTTFTLRVPATLVAGDDLVVPDSSTGRVLVVDDRSEVLDALTSVVEELGFECDRARTSKAASELLSSRRYDVALLDLEMPGRGGAELAEEARRSEGPNRPTRFVATSAVEVDERVLRNFDACLMKPIDHAALRQTLLGIGRGGRPSQPGLWSDS
jgi:signal transduction histidine kinase/CheY-like chemotaxis protein